MTAHKAQGITAPVSVLINYHKRLRLQHLYVMQTRDTAIQNIFLVNDKNTKNCRDKILFYDGRVRDRSPTMETLREEFLRERFSQNLLQTLDTKILDFINKTPLSLF